MVIPDVIGTVWLIAHTLAICFDYWYCLDCLFVARELFRLGLSLMPAECRAIQEILGVSCLSSARGTTCNLMLQKSQFDQYVFG